MKINYLTNFSPAFKAQFANDPETQMILKRNTRKHSEGLPAVYTSLKLLNEIETNDSISLKEDYEANEKEVGFEKSHFIVKNENTGSKISIVADYYKSMIQQLNAIIFDHTTAQHNQLFENSKPIKSYGKFYSIQDYNRYQLERFTKESGDDLIKDKIVKLSQENNELKQKIELNDKKIDKLFDKQLETRSRYVRSLLGLNE